MANQAPIGVEAEIAARTTQAAELQKEADTALARLNQAEDGGNYDSTDPRYQALAKAYSDAVAAISDNRVALSKLVDTQAAANSDAGQAQTSTLVANAQTAISNANVAAAQDAERQANAAKGKGYKTNDEVAAATQTATDNANKNAAAGISNDLGASNARIAAANASVADLKNQYDLESQAAQTALATAQATLTSANATEVEKASARADITTQIAQSVAKLNEIQQKWQNAKDEADTAYKEQQDLLNRQTADKTTAQNEAFRQQQEGDTLLGSDASSQAAILGQQISSADSRYATDQSARTARASEANTFQQNLLAGMQTAAEHAAPGSGDLFAKHEQYELGRGLGYVNQAAGPAPTYQAPDSSAATAAAQAVHAAAMQAQQNSQQPAASSGAPAATAPVTVNVNASPSTPAPAAAPLPSFATAGATPPGAPPPPPGVSPTPPPGYMPPAAGKAYMAGNPGSVGRSVGSPGAQL